MKKIILVLLVAVFLSSCTTTKNDSFKDFTMTTEMQNELNKKIDGQMYKNIKSFLIMHDGELIYEKYAPEINGD